jgi:hypothetical protein
LRTGWFLDYDDQQRTRASAHNPALRQLANRLVGILSPCR